MKIRKYITTKMLESIGAILGELDAFLQEFPSGRATWQRIVEVKDKDDAFASLAAWLGRDCPADIVDATWASRQALQRNDADRALLGCFCPADVKGATWAARKALQRNYRELSWLGLHCPVGVKGATLKARLSVQPCHYDRECVMEKFGNEKGGE